MLRIFLGIVFLTSCTLGSKSSGGKHRYRYEPDFEYTIEDLRELSPSIVSMQKRDPSAGTLEKLFDPKLPDMKRIGIVVFESEVQATRSGLSGHDKIYPSEKGKQLITEQLLTQWDEGMSLVAPDLEYVRSGVIQSSKAIKLYGLEVEDFIKTDRTSIASDDILWLPSGKKTPLYTVMNPRGMRDLSFMLVPASELMGGPKWSEQNKIFLNDICKELGLDAVIVIMSSVSWTAERKDKFTNENLPEEMRLKIKATTLVPFGEYHERLKILKESERPVINVAYRFHEGELKIPVQISIPENEKNYEQIEKRILSPMFKAYRDLSFMMIDRIAEEIRKTN